MLLDYLANLLTPLWGPPFNEVFLVPRVLWANLPGLWELASAENFWALWASASVKNFCAILLDIWGLLTLADIWAALVDVVSVVRGSWPWVAFWTCFCAELTITVSEESSYTTYGGAVFVLLCVLA
jgi:hypothetical protein